jgi:hypothetical protein
MRLKGLGPSWVHHLKVFMKESKGISLEMKCIQIAQVQMQVWCPQETHGSGVVSNYMC